MRLDKKSLRKAAQESDDCLDWLKHCEAECCNGFRFRLSPTSDVIRAEDEVRVRVRVTADVRHYYELHGAVLEADTVVVPADCCTFTKDRLHVSMPCAALTPDFRCALHPDDKPELCKGLTLQTVRDREYWASPNCLFTYKLQLPVDGNGVEE